MGLFGRFKCCSVLSRAILVALVLMSLAFTGTAYYCYNSNAAQDYLCSNYKTPECNPMSSDDRYKMYMPGEKKYISIYVDRLLIDGASMHISKTYLQNKYPDIFNDFNNGYINMLGADEQADMLERMKQQRQDYHSELSSMKSDINKYHESRYIEEAFEFAAKWTLLLPLSLVFLLCIVLGIKNYILHGRVMVAIPLTKEAPPN